MKIIKARNYIESFNVNNDLLNFVLSLEKRLGDLENNMSAMEKIKEMLDGSKNFKLNIFRGDEIENYIFDTVSNGNKNSSKLGCIKLPIVRINGRPFSTELQLDNFCKALCSEDNTYELYSNLKKDWIKQSAKIKEKILTDNEVRELFKIKDKRTFEKIKTMKNSPMSYEYGEYYASAVSLQKWFLKNEGKRLKNR